MRRLAFATALALIAIAAFGQPITTPPSGDNQHAIVTQFIGPVKVTVDYNSPKVHHPTTHEDRRGKIWGTLVPYGLTNQNFGTCTECPWRAGANQNTTFTFSYPVKIEGQDIPAGTYGFFLIADPNEWTAIFSKNYTSWGSFFYNPAEDQLRVKVKPEKSAYNEWLTYEFTERQPDQATVAMRWEDLQVPLHITVPNITDVYLAQIHKELRNFPGFNWQNWNQAARYALREKRLDDALEFAKGAADSKSGVGQENFQTLTTLADVQEARGMTAEATSTRTRALALSTASPVELHMYARQQMQKGNKAEAVRVWQMNAKLHPKDWPINVGLMRAYSAQGNYKEALKYAKLALAEAPDPQNKASLEDAVKKLTEGKDVNG
jgi:tetratricopeptide (TPR) repeat protein